MKPRKIDSECCGLILFTGYGQLLAQGEARSEFCAAGDEFDFTAVFPPIPNVDFIH